MKIKHLFIDLFCGAGGVTSGIHEAMFEEERIAEVVTCINHDANAIKSHFANYPECVHFTEDIRTISMSPILAILNERIKYWEARGYQVITHLWASLECTNFSRAKGGQPRDADSRTLADHLFRYIESLRTDYIWIENVEEFMCWGPLDENGKPVSKHQGRDYMNWVSRVMEKDYKFDHKILNSADYGANTSRKRFFGCFARPKLPIQFPPATHSKNPDNGMFSNLKKWKPVKECLDFSDEGNSIFIDLAKLDYKKGLKYLLKKEKKKPEVTKKIVLFPSYINNPIFGMEPKLIIEHSEVSYYDDYVQKFCNEQNLNVSDINFFRYDPYSKKTLERIYAGLIKYVAGGKDAFIKKYFSGRPAGKVNSVDDPCSTITARSGLALVKVNFISKYYSGDPDSKNQSIDEPAGTITCVDHHSLVNASFIQKYNSNNAKTGINNGADINDPCPTVTTQVRMTLVQASFLKQYNSGSDDARCLDLEKPCNTIPTNNRFALVQPKFLMKYHGTGENVISENDVCSTLTTKDRLALVQPEYFLDKQYSGKDNHQSIESPSGSIMSNDKHALVKAQKWIMNTNYNAIGSSIDQPCGTITANRKWHYLMNPSWGGNNGDINQPCCTIVARQDKAPLYCVMVDQDGPLAIAVYDEDYEIMVKIKEFMAIYNIVDIKMRMLKVLELLKIQGFKEGYVLIGNQSEQKKFIGNSVVPRVVKAMIETIHVSLQEYFKMAA